MLAGKLGAGKVLRDLLFTLRAGQWTDIMTGCVMVWVELACTVISLIRLRGNYRRDRSNGKDYALSSLSVDI